MFCEETIEKVYLGQPEYHDNGNYFLDCYYDMAIHLCGQYRLVLETDSHYITLETTGVFKLDKTGPVETIEKDGEWIEPCIHVDEEFNEIWTDYETTLFVGERLLSVTENEGGHLLTFDDFTINLIPHSSPHDFPCHNSHAYSRVYGTERLIKKCRCGGTGELILDFVSDYGIRCNKCLLGTYANQCACDAIDEWNNSNGLIEIGYYPEEEFQIHCHEPIAYIVADRHYSKPENDTLRCRSIIVKLGELKFKISSRYAGNGKNDFCFESLSSFNPEIWPEKINAAKNGPISFIKKDNSSGQGASLFFHVGEHILTVTAEKAYLIITTIDGFLEET